jgi:putative ABC transport system permease protein
VNLFRLAWIGVRRRPLASALTALYIGLGTALALLVVAVRASTERSFQDAARGYDLLLAPQNGSGLQAVLSTLFFVDEPAGTLPWSVYETWSKDPRVKAAVPYAMGDTYKGHRVVGTSADHFAVLTDARGRTLGDGVTGRLFAPDVFEAVVGSLVARAGSLALGGEFQVSHGVKASTHVHAERWKVVGVLRPTGTPQDRAIFIPIGSFYEIEGHQAPAANGADQGGEHGEGEEHEHGGPGAPDEPERRLSAVGLRLMSPYLRLQVFGEIRSAGKDVQAVMPADEVLNLVKNVIGPVDTAFRWTAALVLVVGGLGILVGLYNTLQGRRREIAVLRALGARRAHVFAVILLEGVLLCLLGGLLGLVLGHGAVVALAPTALADYGVRVEADLGLLDLLLLGGLVVLGAVAALLPAWRGLSTPVAPNLSPLEG